VKQVLVKSGGVVVEEVPAPQVSARNILVRVVRTCVSVGTELASVRGSGEPLYRRALKHPENIRKVFQKLRENGIQNTANFVQTKLHATTATGYSAAGVVIEVGSEVDGFSVGDRVACAGATASHAEIIDVPVNLAVRIPDNVDFDAAATVTLGAIALQGVRRAAPTMGETIVVVGLGILGQITSQLLRANGCHVIGVDITAERIKAAQANGLEHGIDSTTTDYVDRVFKLTDGFGADAVIVTAASQGNELISQAMRACRKKGRVVLVGDVGLQLNRADFYSKELDFLISTSYGPGRYDPVYEEAGQDYPLPYVRWTENRNMLAYLRLIAEGRISLASLDAVTFEVGQASMAYARLGDGGATPLMVLLSYPQTAEPAARAIPLKTRTDARGRIRVALVGAGTFAQAVHLPNLAKLNGAFALHAVSSRTGANAKAIATQFGAAYATTDYRTVLDDPDVDLVLISTRHHLHGRLVLDALRAGKHVFVEKPLTIIEDELREIEAHYAAAAGPLLITGFNRRFAPAIQRARELLSDRTTPLMISYRMNAGYVPRESWVHGPEGGGRNLGEACHIYDLFGMLTNARVRQVSAAAIAPKSAQWARNDNFSTIITYEDGSVCTLTYTALGHRDFPKEQMDIWCDGAVLKLDDYRSLQVFGRKQRGWSGVQDKGQLDELKAVALALRGETEWPIPLWQQVQATRIAFEVERQLTAAV
jgi:predicted dehydrogenase/threonine dehydrogenase-like Zn-dependent dehydrogenase